MSEEPEALSELESAVLSVARDWRLFGSNRTQAIREATGLSSNQYFVMLSAMIEDPRVWKADPVLVDRLRRMRDLRLDERG